MIPGIVLLIPELHPDPEHRLDRHISGHYRPDLPDDAADRLFHAPVLLVAKRRDRRSGAAGWGDSVHHLLADFALPLAGPALATIAILTFVGSWNDYLWPLVVGRDEEVRMLTVAPGLFRSQQQTSLPDWAGLMAAATLMIIPTLLPVSGAWAAEW